MRAQSKTEGTMRLVKGAAGILLHGREGPAGQDAFTPNPEEH